MERGRFYDYHDDHRLGHTYHLDSITIDRTNSERSATAEVLQTSEKRYSPLFEMTAFSSSKPYRLVCGW